MKICIDTNAYASFRRGDTWVNELLETAEEIFVPTVVLGELYAGFYQGKHTQKNIDELEEFLQLPGVWITEITRPIAERYGYLIKTLKEKGTPLPTNDIWIAASVLETGAKLLTFDKHFHSIPGIFIIPPPHQ